MSDKVDILAIDDDKFVQKLISKALDSDSVLVRSANNGDKGIEMAKARVPDIILLDVEMPGINGYETCEILRNTKVTSKIPIVFLSSHSSLRERMQGYEAGGNDYLVKPFENENLSARVNILIKYQKERIALQEQYQIAKTTAVVALTGTSELGLAMQFLEKSIVYASIEELMQGLFEGMERFNLDCCAMARTNKGDVWFTSKNAISPIEKELIEMSDKDVRFLDFGQRTIVNFPLVSLLVRNMPLEDNARYGRIKDLLPILISAVNVKLSSLETQIALNEQSQDMLNAFKNIRSNLFSMGSIIISNREGSKKITDELTQDLHADLLGMGLEEEQENYLLERIDSVVIQVMEKLDVGVEIHDLLNFISSNMKSLVDKQESLLEEFNKSLSRQVDKIDDQLDDGVELF